MDISRREFLPMLLAAVLAPRCCLSAEQKPKVTINAYIKDIPGIKCEILTEAFRKVADFYKKAGSGHNLPGIELEFRLVDGTKYAMSTKDNHNFTLLYATTDDVRRNPRELLQAFGGDDYVARLNGAIRTAADEKGITYDKAEKEVFERELAVIYETLKGELGFGSNSAKKIWLFAPEQQSQYSRQQLVNLSAMVTAHEIGHVMGLEHTAEEKSNLMKFPSEADTIYSFTPTINRPQLEKMLNTL